MRARIALGLIAALTASACGQRAQNCVDVTTQQTPAFSGSGVNAHGDDTTGLLDINGQAISIDFIDTTPYENGGLVAHYTMQYIEDDAPTTFTSAGDLAAELINTQDLSSGQARDLKIVLDGYLDNINDGFEVGYRHGVENVAGATEALNEELRGITTDHPASTVTQQVCAADAPLAAEPAGYSGDGVYVTDAPEQPKQGSPWLAVLGGIGGALLLGAWYRQRQNFTHENTVTAKLKNVDHTVVILRNENIRDECHKQAYWVLAQADNDNPVKAAKGKVRLYSTNAAGRDAILAAEQTYSMHPALIQGYGNVLGKNGDEIGSLCHVLREGPVRKALEAVEAPEGEGNTQRVLKAAAKQLKFGLF